MSPLEPEEGWSGFHIFYHGDKDLVLTELVRPLTASLLAERAIGRFFCIRYPLGGPHVRFRAEVDAAEEARVGERVRDAAARFFQRHPSTTTLPDERIRRENRGVIASDPFADDTDDVVFPDNSVARFPVHIETARYGGPGLYQHSLDFFTLSTLESLRFLEVHAGQSAGRRTAGALRLLVRQGWGHACSVEEFVTLVGYGVAMFGRRLAGLIPVADAAFERSRDALCSLVRGELASLAERGAKPVLAEAARALRHAVATASDERRRVIGTSHLHMTANRLGLLNSDEVYFCRMLSRSLEAVAAADPGFWNAAWSAHREWVPTPACGLSERARSAVADLAR